MDPWWFDTGQTPGTHESRSLAVPCTEERKNSNKGFMSWEKDQERILQGQDRLILEEQNELIASSIRGG